MSDELDLDVLAESFAEVLGAEWPREQAIAFSRSGAPLAIELWQAIAGLGWPALTVPELHGGLGLGLPAAARLHAALGAAVVPAPMLGTTLAVALLVHAGSEEQQARWLPRLASGEVRAAVAAPDAQPVSLESGAVSGTVADLADAPAADLLLVRARNGERQGYLLVRAEADGVTIERHLLADVTRSLGTVRLDRAAADAAAFIATDGAIDDELLRTACVAIAADAIGGGEAVLAATIEYMKGREQFGRPIGSFQALKHRVADHQAALVAARGLVEAAADHEQEDPRALLAALSAKQHVTRLVAELARDCIQLHGGVGFTSEYVPHLYLKRGKLNEALFGSRIVLLDRVADLLEAA